MSEDAKKQNLTDLLISWHKLPDGMQENLKNIALGMEIANSCEKGEGYGRKESQRSLEAVGRALV